MSGWLWLLALARHISQVIQGEFQRRDDRSLGAAAYVPLVARTARQSSSTRRVDDSF